MRCPETPSRDRMHRAVSALPELTETRPREDVSVFTLGGDDLVHSYGSNATVVFGPEGAVVVDPFVSPVYAARLGVEIERRTARPIALVVLTHHHTDHALGAAFFAARGARVVATAACAARMAAEHPGLIEARREASDPPIAALFRGAVPVEPTETFSGELRTRAGGLDCVIRHAGHAHTPGDATVHVPSLGLVVCGDLVSCGYHVNFEDADAGGFESALRSLALEPGALFVPGHGPPGGREVVVEGLRYLETVRDAARERPPAAVGSELLARFPGYRLSAAVETAAARFADHSRIASATSSA